MKIIGLTGGIGTGKSTILNLFKKLGINTFNADESAKQIINTDLETIKSVKRVFGDSIYEKGVLNKKKISRIVFNSSEKLALLNSIIHPKVAVDFNKFCEKNKNDHYVVKEAALIFDTNSEEKYDKIILVTAPLEERIERVMKRDKITREKVLKRIKSQLDHEKLSHKCDFVINNLNEAGLIVLVNEIHNTILDSI
ncbi:MAG: dephospho-CoA kinase [Bacteroidota bacterium]